MSRFFLAQRPGTFDVQGFARANDARIAFAAMPEADETILTTFFTHGDRQYEDALLWPRSRLTGPDANSGNFTVDNQTSGRWGPDLTQNLGARSSLFLAGTTRDSNGDPLASVTVDAFLTATDVKVGSTVSDSGGYFAVPSPFSGQAHYLVAYKPGSPDVSGTSVDTLIPS